MPQPLLKSSIEKMTSDPVAPQQTFKDIVQTVSFAKLHSPITMEGKTESTINKVKFPGIKRMGFTALGLFVIEGARDFVICSGTTVIYSVV